MSLKCSGTPLRNLCRTCMSTKPTGEMKSGKVKMIGLHSSLNCENTDLTIIELLRLLQPQIQTQLEDSLPKTICIACLEELKRIYEFMQIFKNADEKFRKFLKELDSNNESGNEHKEETVEIFDGQNERYEYKKAISDDVGVVKVEDIEVQDSYPQFEAIIIQNDLSEHEELEQEAEDSDNLFNAQQEAEVSDNPFNDQQEAEVSDNSFDAIDYDEDWSDTEKSKKKSVAKTRRRCKKTKSKRPNIKKLSKEELAKEIAERQPPMFNDDGFISCGECDSLLSEVTLWRQHMLDHYLGKLPRKKGRKKGIPQSHQCEHCEKVFQLRSDLNRHVLTHTNELPYQCVECGKKLRSAIGLKSHMLRHKGVKIHQCPHCPMSFVVHSGLYNHIKHIHEEIRRHLCDICGKAFSLADTLKKHKVIHSTTKDYPCDYCHKRFVTHGKLRRHIRTHTGEKPYSCKYCDRCYSQSSEINTHMKRHLGDNIFICDLCPLRFKYHKDMRIHFATHKDDDEETRARNLEARAAEEKNLLIICGVKNLQKSL